MRYFFLVLCLILCSCFFNEEAELGNSSNSTIGAEPSILDCPAEDIAEYPIPDELPDDWMQTTPDGACASEIKTSKEELLFDAKGGVRCITTDRLFGGVSISAEGCVREEPQHSYSGHKKITCPWITATKVSDRILHISVNQNETGVERNLDTKVISLYCSGSTLVTQSAEY